MRKISILAVALLLCAGTAQAGTLTSATWAGEFQGNPYTLTSDCPNCLVASGTSVGTSANVSITVPLRLFTTLQTGGTAPIFISQTLGGSQDIAINGGVSANQPIEGLVNVYVGNDNTGLLLFTVPLAVGVDPAANPFFQITTLVPGFNIPVSVTASAFGWTTGTFSFAASTESGVAVPTPFIAAGGNDLTAGGGGTITLVAPSITRVCAGAPFSTFPCNGGSQLSTSASATTLTLNFVGEVVPEPGTLLLLGAGLAGLAAVGRRQRA